MTSKLISATKAYVWIWLPNQVQPVPAGVIEKKDTKYVFAYAKSYRARNSAISLSPFELPLQSGVFEPTGLNDIHSCLRDASPDAWGRRVILHEYPTLQAGELDFMLLSGSNRIGALDFQNSDSEYIPRVASASLKNLLTAAESVEKGIPIPPELEKAFLQGTSVGGARPKCLIQDNAREFIAKFPLTSDLYDLIKAEYIAMRLAHCASINVAQVSLERVAKKNVLLVERFDRNMTSKGTTRRLLLSGLSLLGLNEMEARYASYPDFADIIRQHFLEPKQDLKELFNRLAFNVLIGNTDDHARNYSAFWDGTGLCLTPAYDLLPQLRSGGEASQAMKIEGVQGNISTLINVLSIAHKFLLTEKEAREIIESQIDLIHHNWPILCEEADLPIIERKKLWQTTILNPACFYGWK